MKKKTRTLPPKFRIVLSDYMYCPEYLQDGYWLGFSGKDGKLKFITSDLAENFIANIVGGEGSPTVVSYFDVYGKQIPFENL